MLQKAVILYTQWYPRVLTLPQVRQFVDFRTSLSSTNSFMDTLTSSSSVFGTYEILPPRCVDGIHNPKSGNIYPYHGIGLISQSIHRISLPNLYKNIFVDALTASSLGLWNYKTHSHTCVNVGGIHKTVYFPSIMHESCTYSDIIGC